MLHHATCTDESIGLLNTASSCQMCGSRCRWQQQSSSIAATEQQPSSSSRAAAAGQLPVDELSLCLWGCAFTELPAAVMVCLVLSPSCHGRRGAPYPHDIANIFAAVFSGSQGLALGV